MIAVAWLAVLCYAGWQALRAGWQAHVEAFTVPVPSSGDGAPVFPSAGAESPGPAAFPSTADPPELPGREHL